MRQDATLRAVLLDAAGTLIDVARPLGDAVWIPGGDYRAHAARRGPGRAREYICGAASAGRPLGAG